MVFSSLLRAVGFGAALLLVALGSARADGNGTYVVRANDTRSMTIQAAIDYGYKRILVSPGVYNENLVVPSGASVTISGVGSASRSVIDGGGAGIVVYVASGANLTLDRLTIRNGFDYVGAGILNDGGAVSVSNSIVTGNTGIFGGGIYNFIGTLKVVGSLITKNSADYGAGVYNDGGTATIRSSGVFGNTATSGGGGIYNYLNPFASAPATLTLTGSAVWSNTALQGGGIYNDGATASLYGSTVVFNTAEFEGGGVYNYFGTLDSDPLSAIFGNAPDQVFDLF